MKELAAIVAYPFGPATSAVDNARRQAAGMALVCIVGPPLAIVLAVFLDWMGWL